MRNPRFLALTTLEKVEHGAFIQEAFDPKDLKEADRNLAETIVYGTVQNKLFLDYVIHRFVKSRKAWIKTSVNSCAWPSIKCTFWIGCRTTRWSTKP